MLYFTGILLYLAVGAVAAPALQARETSDSGEPTSVVGNPGASSVQSSPAASDQTGASSVQSSPAASDQTGASSVQSSPAASDQTSAAASAAAASGLPLGTDDSTDSTSDSSDSTAGSTDGTSTGSNQTLLYGSDSRPNITHLAAIQDATKDAENKTMFEAAGSILLALTKCNDQGNWIKSLFVNGTNEESSGNPNITNVHVHTINNDSAPGYNITIDRANMTNITSYGIKMDTIPANEPWWPWALIEAGLQAGWTPKSNGTEEDYNVADLLKIFTGVNVTNVAPTEEFYDDVEDHLQSSPILVWKKDRPVYSVIMTPSADDSDKYPLAGPYNTATFENDEPKSLKELDVRKVLYLDCYATLPEVEAKAKENDEALPESVESALDNAKSSGAEESAKGESTGAGESAKAESTGPGQSGAESSKVESTGTTTQGDPTAVGSSPVESSPVASSPVESSPVVSSPVESGSPAEPTP